MLLQLLDRISAEATSLRTAISRGDTYYVPQYLQGSDRYLAAPDLRRDTWMRLDGPQREAFYLFILMNELHSDKDSCCNLLQNIWMYFPTRMNLSRRLKLFASLMQTTHIQQQYRAKTLDFFRLADEIYGLTDEVLERPSIRSLILHHYRTFILRSRASLNELGQETHLMSVLPEVVGIVETNVFVLESLTEIISILKGDQNEVELDIHFLYN